MLAELKSKLLWMLGGMLAFAAIVLAFIARKPKPQPAPFVKPKEVPKDLKKVKDELKKRGLIE